MATVPSSARADDAHAARGDACLIGDLLHARAVDAAPDENLVGGVEDAGLGVRCGLPRWFNHLVRKSNLSTGCWVTFFLGF